MLRKTLIGESAGITHSILCAKVKKSNHEQSSAYEVDYGQEQFLGIKTSRKDRILEHDQTSSSGEARLDQHVNKVGLRSHLARGIARKVVWSFSDQVKKSDGTGEARTSRKGNEIPSRKHCSENFTEGSILNLLQEHKRNYPL